MKVSLELSAGVGPVPVNYNNPLPVIFGGVAAGSIYHSNGSITNSPTTINFSSPCSSFSIATSPGAADLFINLTGAPASGSGADFRLYGGSGYSYQGQQINSISILGASPSGTYTICAH